MAQADPSLTHGEAPDHVAIAATAEDRDRAIAIIEVLSWSTGFSTDTAGVWRQIGAALKAERLSAGRGEDDLAPSI